MWHANWLYERWCPPNRCVYQDRKRIYGAPRQPICRALRIQLVAATVFDGIHILVGQLKDLNNKTKSLLSSGSAAVASRLQSIFSVDYLVTLIN